MVGLWGVVNMFGICVVVFLLCCSLSARARATIFCFFVFVVQAVFGDSQRNDAHEFFVFFGGVGRAAVLCCSRFVAFIAPPF